MKMGRKNLILTLVVICLSCCSVQAESLFQVGISENHSSSSYQPRSLYNRGVARSVGDIVTIELDETITTNDAMKYNLKRNSEINDSFTPLINQALPEKWRLPTEQIDGFGGGQSVNNTLTRERTITYKNTISTQVMQILPNGNLLVQGKKATISNGEKMNIVISGIVDPRWISRAGIIKSEKVANLQMAMVGDGTVSRSDNEGLIQKFFRFIF